MSIEGENDKTSKLTYECGLAKGTLSICYTLLGVCKCAKKEEIDAQKFISDLETFLEVAILCGDGDLTFATEKLKNGN